ncbi:MAG: 2-hydroxyacyl-CoA dehydratase, partial [Synergistes sp.]|nr:2-hydroxyacyl-CoA dehydratase [Synergistes sp.]
MMYYVCKYTPLELLAGFGLPSMRLEPLSDDFETADRLGHANLCGYGKGVLEAAFKEDVRELILVNCCDVIRRVYDILKEKKKMEFLFFLDLPHKHGKADIKYFARELGRLKDACTRYTGRTFELQPFWKMWKEEIGGLTHAVPYVSLLGAHIHPSAFEKIKTHFSPVPVKDDTCGGNRRLGKAPTELEEHMSVSCRYCEVQTDYDPLPAYAEALLLQTPCMRMSDRGGRSSLGKNASGLIYHTMKFCDYFSFEYAERKKYEKIPILKIETSGSAHNAGQLSTRLEAFAESLHLRSDRMGDMKSGRYAVGIDSGSTATKVVIMNEQKEIVGRSIVHTGSGAAASAERALQQALGQHGIAETEISRVVTTGYGREFIDKGDASVTEITCHAKGAYFLDPSVRTVIDIGGQDS